MEVLGKFRDSAVAGRILGRLDDLSRIYHVTRSYHKDFVDVRDCVVILTMLENARRTGDLVHMTLAEWRAASTSQGCPDDHVVYVKHHKTAKSLRCGVNFHGDLYATTAKYVAAFGSEYLSSGYVIPHVPEKDAADPGRQMSGSQMLKYANRIWAQFAKEANDPRVPARITSRLIRHSVVTAVHATDDSEAMQDAATAMSHSLATARRHYDEHIGASALHRAGNVIRQLLASNKPGE